MGLGKWFSEEWVDIGSPKKGGGFEKCGRKKAKGSKRKYPKCVPRSKAKSMTAAQRSSAVKRKRAAGNPGGKPTNVKTFAKDGKLIRKHHKGCGKVMSNRRKKTRYS